MNMSRVADAIERLVRRKMESSLMSGLVVGTVVEAAPLRVTLDNQLVLPPDCVTLSPLVVARRNLPTEEEGEGEYNYTHQHAIQGTTQPGGDGHTHEIDFRSAAGLTREITDWRGLVQGDEVLILRYDGGSRYLVLCRCEPLTNIKDDEPAEGGAGE